MLRKMFGHRRRARRGAPHEGCTAATCGAATYVYPGVARLCVARAKWLDAACPAALVPAACGEMCCRGPVGCCGGAEEDGCCGDAGGCCDVAGADADAARALAAQAPAHTAGINAGEEGEHGECAVCLDPFTPGLDLTRSLPCGHTFHSACLLRWLSQKLACPVCRTHVPAPAGARCGHARAAHRRRLRPVTLMRRSGEGQGEGYTFVLHDTARFAQFAAAPVNPPPPRNGPPPSVGGGAI